MKYWLGAIICASLVFLIARGSQTNALIKEQTALIVKQSAVIDEQSEAIKKQSNTIKNQLSALRVCFANMTSQQRLIKELKEENARLSERR